MTQREIDTYGGGWIFSWAVIGAAGIIGSGIGIWTTPIGIGVFAFAAIAIADSWIRLASHRK